MIALDRVTVRFGEKTVLDGLSLTLPERGAVALMGPSGCGKTTLLRVIAGLVRPSSGGVSGLAGKKIAFLFQEDRLLPWLTALQNVALVADRASARQWLARLEIENADQYPGEMSGGMQRRVALARAMAFAGDPLLLDEPFKGLDAALRARVAGQIRGQAGLTLLSVHDRAEAALMGAEVITLPLPMGGSTDGSGGMDWHGRDGRAHGGASAKGGVRGAGL